MKWITIIALLICTSTSLHAQYQITVDALVLNKQTKQPVPFTNIRFQGKTIKTVSDAKGKITFSYNEDSILPSDTLVITANGYQTQKVTTNQFYRFLKNTNTIYLKPIESTPNVILNEGNISGKVTTNGIPIQGATITIKNSMTQSLSDNEGYYRINAKPEDVLIFEFLGTKTKQLAIGNHTELNIDLESDGEQLGEVYLEGQGKSESKILDTGYGKKNFDAIGYDIFEMPEKDINPSIQTLDQVIRKLPGIIVSGIDPNGLPGNKRYTLLRSNASSIMKDTSPIIVINDVVYHQSDGLPRLPQIDIQSIKKVTLLKSLASTNRYGSDGAYGAIVIKTSASVFDNRENNEKPSLLATGNDYTEQVQPINALNVEPDYLQTLQNTKNFEEAKQTYRTLKQTKNNLSVAFYLDAATYFLKWDKQYAMVIFTYVEELAKDNAKALKTLAYKYESLNLYEKTRLVYQRIALLRPTDAQSYRDLALIYNTTGYYNEAMRLYKQMLSNSIEGVDFSGLQQPITDELMHLLAKHRSKVDYTDIPADVLATKFKQDLRIVFEWNDPNAEFELQFVNPQKKFFKWSHTKFDNRERMIDEIKKGYTTEAYIIDDAEAGEWIINIEALNEKPDINPNYLKYTVYKNYGLPNETKTVKVIQLESITQKVTLDKFMYQQ